MDNVQGLLCTGALSAFSAYLFIEGLITQRVRMGHKWEPWNTRVNRAEHPFKFWYAITFYGSAAIGFGYWLFRLAHVSL